MPEWLIGAFIGGLIGGVITVLLFSLVVAGREQEERQRLVWENEHLKSMLACSYTKFYGRDVDKLKVAADLYDSRGIVLDDVVKAYMLGYEDYEKFVDKAFREAMAHPKSTEDGICLSVGLEHSQNNINLEELEKRLKDKPIHNDSATSEIKQYPIQATYGRVL